MSESRTWWAPLGLLLKGIQENYFTPFLNASVFRLMTWFYGGSNLKSLGELNRLVNEVILADDFQQKDFVGFSASSESERLDKHKQGPSSRLPAKDGWIETSIKISLPVDGVKHHSEADAPQFSVPGLFYRCPLEVLKSAFQEDAAKIFHFSAHQTYWKKSPESPPECIYSELYMADAFIMEEEKIKLLPQEDWLENVVAGIMLWSDSTHLMSFENALLWPIYMFFGNLSKYICAKPTSFVTHHLAYIPKVCSFVLY
jgi:Plavaka transposase